MDISDSRLLNLMQRGDTDALGVLYVRYSAQVRNFAMGFLPVSYTHLTLPTI